MKKMQEIYNKLVHQIVSEILRDPCIKEFCNETDITIDDLIEEIQNYKSNRTRYECPIKICQEMVADEFDDKFKCDSKHCLYFLGGRTNIPPEKMYTFCSRYIPEGGIVCERHLVTNEGKRLNREWVSGKLNLETYQAKKKKARILFAKGKLKASNEIPLYSQVNESNKRLPFFAYPHRQDCKYNKSTGLVVTILNQTNKSRDKMIKSGKIRNGIECVTVGIDTECNGVIRKLNIDDLKNLKNVSLNIDFDTIEEDALKYVNKKVRLN